MTGNYGVAAQVRTGRRELFGTGFNATVATGDFAQQLTGSPLAHAEMNALLNASHSTAGTVLLTTLRPCAMCWVACGITRVARVVYLLPLMASIRRHTVAGSRMASSYETRNPDLLAAAVEAAGDGSLCANIFTLPKQVKGWLLAQGVTATAPPGD